MKIYDYLPQLLLTNSYKIISKLTKHKKKIVKSELGTYSKYGEIMLINLHKINYKLLINLTKNVRVDTLEKKIIILINIDLLDYINQKKLICIIDRTNNTAKYIIIYKQLISLSPNIQSRGVFCKFKNTNIKAPTQLATKIYKNMNTCAKSNKQIDKVTRNIMKLSFNHAIKMKSVTILIKEIAKIAVKNGDYYTMNLATKYAHNIKLTRKSEIMLMNCFYIEAIATLQKF